MTRQYQCLTHASHKKKKKWKKQEGRASVLINACDTQTRAVNTVWFIRYGLGRSCPAVEGPSLLCLLQIAALYQLLSPALPVPSLPPFKCGAVDPP
ncbi:hypothetical protein Nmel_017669 [Mimus melanotis]